MGIIANGKTIPTNGDYIVVNGKVITQVDCVVNGTTTTVWKQAKTKVLFTRTETYDYCDYRWHVETTVNNGWNKATVYTNTGNSVVGTWNKFDVTGYNKCIVRINGYIDSEPSGAIASHTYINIGFSEDYEKNVTTVVHKWASTDEGNIGSGQEGLAYETWYDLELNISKLEGEQTLNVFIGGAYMNGGTLSCSKITLTNE